MAPMEDLSPKEVHIYNVYASAIVCFSTEGEEYLVRKMCDVYGTYPGISEQEAREAIRYNLMAYLNKEDGCISVEVVGYSANIMPDELFKKSAFETPQNHKLHAVFYDIEVQ